MNAFLEQLARFGWGRLAAILGLTAGAAAALMIFTLSMNGSGQALLYSGLEPDDAASVTERLDEAGIAYELRQGGSAVYVDTGEVDAARMRVASGGALGFGSVGYEIFDETDALGTTSFVQNVNARRALEGELARSINTLSGVSRARVHLVLPERRLFSRDRQEPSASVVIQADGELRSGQVATIQNLVATAVAGLAPTRITIADDSGRLLASPTDSDSATSAALEDRRAQIEERLRRRILDIVEGVVGPGAARVAVTAEVSRESSTETRLEYDPNTQVEVSRREQVESSSEPVNDGAVSVSENQPDADQAADGGEPAMATSQSELTERNYENSSTQTTVVREAGDLQRLAVSVVVDQRPVRGEDGSITFEPRSQDELTRIRNLVAAAVGFPVNAELTQGDQILEVEQMAFSRPDLNAGTPAPEGFSLARLDFMRIAEIAVLFITTVLIILLVARPLVRGALGGPAADAAPALAGAAAGQGRIAASGDGGEEQAMLPEGEGAEEEERIDVAQIDGQVKKSSVRKVASLVDQHPDETMGILRTWMHEDA